MHEYLIVTVGSYIMLKYKYNLFVSITYNKQLIIKLFNNLSEIFYI